MPCGDNSGCEGPETETHQSQGDEIVVNQAICDRREVVREASWRQVGRA